LIAVEKIVFVLFITGSSTWRKTTSKIGTLRSPQKHPEKIACGLMIKVGKMGE